MFCQFWKKTKIVYPLEKETCFSFLGALILLGITTVGLHYTNHYLPLPKKSFLNFSFVCSLLWKLPIHHIYRNGLIGPTITILFFVNGIFMQCLKV